MESLTDRRGGDLASVSVSGAALAALTASLALSSEDVDGFILGSVTSATSHTLHDNNDATSSEILNASITALSTLATSFSYYDAAGTVDEAKLEELVEALGQPVIGCFTWRRHSALQPSIREQVMVPAALHILQRIQQQKQQTADSSAPQRPMLFANMSAHSRHGGASTAFQCRLFQNLPGQQALRPVRLRISNIQSSRGYLPAVPLSCLPQVPCPLAPRQEQTPPVSAAVAHLARTFSVVSSRSGAAESAAFGSGDYGDSIGSNARDNDAADANPADRQLRGIASAAVSGLQEQALRAEELYWHLIGEMEAAHPAVSAARADLAARKATIASLHDALIR